jgi:uncharacterized spore protein YtfJ
MEQQHAHDQGVTERGPRPPEQSRIDSGANIRSSMEQAGTMISHFARVASAQSCLGEAVTAGGHSIVPVAAVNLSAGYGMGFGSGSGGDSSGQGSGSGGGGGGGGASSARIVAVIDVSDQGVDVRPIVDATMLGMAGIAIVGLGMLGLFGRSKDGRRLLHFLHI